MSVVIPAGYFIVNVVAKFLVFCMDATGILPEYVPAAYLIMPSFIPTNRLSLLSIVKQYASESPDMGVECIPAVSILLTTP